MSLVNVVGMVVLDNPTSYTNPFQFEVTFECLSELDDDLEWKVTYVGSAEDSTKDQGEGAGGAKARMKRQQKHYTSPYIMTASWSTHNLFTRRFDPRLRSH